MRLTDSIISEIITSINNFLDDTERIFPDGWRKMRETVSDLVADGHMNDLHEAMDGLYKRYLYGEGAIYEMSHYDARTFVTYVIDLDDDFDKVAASLDMMELTDIWIHTGPKQDDYMRLLKILSTIDYETDWGRMYDDVNKKILELEVCGDNSGGEYYCILHGFLMIMTASQNYQQRRTRFELFCEHWEFLRHLYSVMIRRIIGMKHSNFSCVANNATTSAHYIPYLRLLYASLIERHDDLCKLGTKEKSLDKAISRIREVMSTNEQSEELDELCEVLFPEEIREMLNTHRLPSYHQLRDENLQLREQQQELYKKIQEQAEQTNAQIAKLTEAMKEGVEAAIPVEHIEQELMKLPAGMAWDMFNELYKLLGANKIWRQYDISIREKLQKRLESESASKVNVEGDYVMSKKVTYKED